MSTTTAVVQAYPAAAMGGGEFVVAWQNGFSSGADISARRFSSATGAPAGGEFRVNVTTTGYQGKPAVGKRLDGGFVVVWVGSQVYGRVFGPNGSPATGEFRVNVTTTLASGVAEPRVAVEPGGGFVVVWSGGNSGFDRNLVLGRRYAASGTPLGGEFRVNADTSPTVKQPDVSIDTAGNFVVAWSSYVANDESDIRASTFDATGAPHATDFRVNTYTTYLQIAPSVSNDGAGRFVVAWWRVQAFASDLRAQRYDVTGAAVGSEFLVSALYASAYQLRAAAAPDAGFVVAWYLQDYQTVVARRFLASGLPAGAASTVATLPANIYPNPAIGIDERDLVIAWNSPDPNGGIYARLYRYGRKAGDVNGDGLVDVSDVFFLINFLFAGGPPPP